MAKPAMCTNCGAPLRILGSKLIVTKNDNGQTVKQIPCEKCKRLNTVD